MKITSRSMKVMMIATEVSSMLQEQLTLLKKKTIRNKPNEHDINTETSRK